MLVDASVAGRSVHAVTLACEARVFGGVPPWRTTVMRSAKEDIIRLFKAQSRQNVKRQHVRASGPGTHTHSSRWVGFLCAGCRFLRSVSK